MAGGTWVSQNKERPGAYINFNSVTAPEVEIGSRGIATIALPLKWGEQGKLIDLYSTDLQTGDSLAKIGLTVNDKEEIKLLKAILANTYLCKVYNLNKGGAKAKNEEDEAIKIEAKYEGTFGNEIVVKVTKVTESFYEVTTYADGYEVDTQRINNRAELKDNNYVTFSGEGELSETKTLKLANGEDGQDEGTEFENYLKVLRISQWQTLAVTETKNNDKAIEFIQDVRENEGLYVQAVINDTNNKADYEGIINSISSVVIDDITYTAPEFTAWVAGATAGAEINESNTGKVVTGASEIIDGLNNNEIVTALKNGKFLLSLNQNGDIKVEKDINSLHTFTTEKAYTFSKNRVIRTIDEIASSIKDVWETTYLGKVSNNEAGRTMFKSSIIDYLTNLENQGAIQDFDTDTVNVEQGADIDSVLVDISIKPVDSMEFLYMTINVDTRI